MRTRLHQSIPWLLCANNINQGMMVNKVFTAVGLEIPIVTNLGNGPNDTEQKNINGKILRSIR
ncbi:Uncharacterised protein [Citrobacter freundii]|nr:Uncharacterised protein [Citrobacter freundii]